MLVAEKRVRGLGGSRCSRLGTQQPQARFSARSQLRPQSILFLLGACSSKATRRNRLEGRDTLLSAAPTEANSCTLIRTGRLGCKAQITPRAYLPSDCKGYNVYQLFNEY